jgi:hypothetical protein
MVLVLRTRILYILDMERAHPSFFLSQLPPLRLLLLLLMLLPLLLILLLLLKLLRLVITNGTTYSC